MMTRDEYDALGLPEATVTFHRNPGGHGVAEDTYVTVEWREIDSFSGLPMRQGFKFVVSPEAMERFMPDG